MDDDAIVVNVPWFVYILRCNGGGLYVGQTSNLQRRLGQHRDGSACAFTAMRRPLNLAYSEPFPALSEARRRERQLKRWTRAKKEALIAGDRALLKRL